MRRTVVLGLVVALFAGVTAPVLAATATITIAGSTALLPLVKAAAQRYSEHHPEIKINVSGGGSGSGLTQVAADAVDIGNSDIPAPGSTTLHDHRVAVIGFAVIVNGDITLRSLDRQRLADIFSGQVVNWRELGGPDEAIVVVNRPRSSGTRKVFRRMIMGTAPIADSGLTVDASGTVATTVLTTPGAISYVALSALKMHHVRALDIDGVPPTVDAIKSGRYPLWAYEHMFTNGTERPESLAFIRAVTTDTSLLTSLGYIPIGAMHITKTDR